MPSSPRQAVKSPPATLWPSIAIVASAFLWGTWWIPLRQLDAAGAGGAWAISAGLILPLLIFLPLGLINRRRILAGGWLLAVCGFLLAATVALYGEALMRGHVARVILLFYLTPVWSSFFGWALVAEPITPRRVATIILGLAGMFVIFGIGEGVPMPRGVAEWMALTSGVCWGLGLAYLRQLDFVSVIDKTTVLFLFVGVIFILLTLVPGGREWSVPSTHVVIQSFGWLFAVAFVWTLPLLWLSMFGGSEIDPGRVSILLMVEIVVGLTSAALLTDEPFGMREFIGAVLITVAGTTEFFAGVVPRRQN